VQPPHEPNHQPSHESRRAAVTDLPGRPCSIAAALTLVGERWSLLVLRELSLGHHRFDALVRNTGAPRDVLTARLRSLEATGIIERRPYQERPPRFEYHLTDAGRELSPVLHTLRAWGDRWAAPDGPPARFTHACGEPLDPVLTCRACGGEVTAASVTPA
jgi:DNA-binding HxlR family transcriptional regulator